jgi:hypothetical protein
LCDDLEAWEEQSNGPMNNLDELLLSNVLASDADALEGATVGPQGVDDSLAMLERESSALLPHSDTELDSKEEEEEKEEKEDAADDGTEWVPGSDGVENAQESGQKRRRKGSKDSRLVRRCLSSTSCCRRAVTPSLHRIAGCARAAHRVRYIGWSSVMPVIRTQPERAR